MEFEISQDGEMTWCKFACLLAVDMRYQGQPCILGKRHIDSIYNHIAGAIFNLGSQVSSASGMYSNDQREKIGECLDELNRHLDLDMTRVVVEDMEAAVPEAVAAQPPSAGMDMID
eukprot:81641-Chlamydomonas_euryale.AAC.23